MEATRQGRRCAVVLLGDPDTGLPVDLPNIDQVSGSQTAIAWEHSRIHAGKAFQKNGKYSVANGTSLLFLFNPAGAVPHMRSLEMVTNSSPVEIELYEAPTVSVNGTLSNGLNLNRMSATVPTMQIYQGPTVTDNGTLLAADATAGNKHNGGVNSDAAETEWVLNSTRLYLARVTNNSGGAANVILRMFWYEGDG